MAIVSLLDVSLSFGGAPLLDRVNLQIDRGERVCLVGRNGAGKSTLMKVIAGELKPDSGKVFAVTTGESFAKLAANSEIFEQELEPRTTARERGSSRADQGHTKKLTAARAHDSSAR